MLLHGENQKNGQSEVSQFYTSFNSFPANFTSLYFHLLKSSETDSWGKYLQCRSAHLQKLLKIWLFWQRKTDFPGFVFRPLLANTPFLLEIQCYDSIYIGAGSGQTSTDFSSSTSLSSFCPHLSSCLSSCVPALSLTKRSIAGRPHGGTITGWKRSKITY